MANCDVLGTYHVDPITTPAFPRPRQQILTSRIRARLCLFDVRIINPHVCPAMLSIASFLALPPEPKYDSHINIELQPRLHNTISFNVDVHEKTPTPIFFYFQLPDAMWT